MSTKGYWRWRVLRRQDQYQGSFKAWWWPIWKTPYSHYWHGGPYSHAEAKEAIIASVKAREKARSFRQAAWEMVEEGRYPE
jgi:hypothetical protein